MKTAIASLESLSPYSQSRFHQEEKLEKESANDYEKRCWKHRCHTTKDGYIFIPPMALKNALSEAAAFLGEKIPGKRNATWTKHFEAGVIVQEPLVLPLHIDDVEGEWLHLNSDGKRGGGTRVLRCYPCIPQWAGDATFYVIDETITQEAFRHFLEEAGKFIGIGRFRPRNRGYYGRFKVVGLKWL